MALFVVIFVSVWVLILTLLLPKVTPYSWQQWGITLGALCVLGMPAFLYLNFAVLAGKQTDPRHTALLAAANMVVVVPVFSLIVKRVLKKP